MIMREIYENGPITFNFKILPDTFRYRAGIYVPYLDRDILDIQFE